MGTEGGTPSDVCMGNCVDHRVWSDYEVLPASPRIYLHSHSQYDANSWMNYASLDLFD
jgi:hypothetical protein